MNTCALSLRSPWCRTCCLSDRCRLKVGRTKDGRRRIGLALQASTSLRSGNTHVASRRVHLRQGIGPRPRDRDMISMQTNTHPPHQKLLMILQMLNSFQLVLGPSSALCRFGRRKGVPIGAHSYPVWSLGRAEIMIAPTIQFLLGEHKTGPVESSLSNLEARLGLLVRLKPAHGPSDLQWQILPLHCWHLHIWEHQPHLQRSCDDLFSDQLPLREGPKPCTNGSPSRRSLPHKQQLHISPTSPMPLQPLRQIASAAAQRVS